MGIKWKIFLADELHFRVEEELGMRGKKDKLAVAFGSGVAEKRKKKGLTQGQLAGLLGITQDSLSRIESGEIGPKFSRLQEIADALSCSVVDLFRFASPESLKRAAVLSDLLQALPDNFQHIFLSMIESAVRSFREGNNKDK